MSVNLNPDDLQRPSDEQVTPPPLPRTLLRAKRVDGEQKLKGRIHDLYAKDAKDDAMGGFKPNRSDNYEVVADDDDDKEGESSEGSIASRIFEAFLDPVVQQRLLMCGGLLFVIGLIITLISYGVFDNPIIAALGLGVASLGVMAFGMWVVLKTKFELAGQALVFLTCVILPLNLWFYHAQKLITIDNGLWVGGVICVAIYTAIVAVLKKPFFIYAVEIGIGLTALLLLAQFQKFGESNIMIGTFLTLSIVSMIGQLIFPKLKEAKFPRDRFGVPFFVSGHIYLVLSLGTVLLALLEKYFLQFAQFPSMTKTVLTLSANGDVAEIAAWVVAAGIYFYSAFFKQIRFFITAAILCLIASSIQFMHVLNLNLFVNEKIIIVQIVGLMILVASKILTPKLPQFASQLGQSGIGFSGRIIVALTAVAILFQQCMLWINGGSAGVGVGFEQYSLMNPGVKCFFAGFVITAIAAVLSRREFRNILGTLSGLLLVATVGSLLMNIDLNNGRKIEIAFVAVGLLMLCVSVISRVKSIDEYQNANISLASWIGSFIVCVTLLVSTNIFAGQDFLDEAILLVSCMVLLTLGIGLKLLGPVVCSSFAIAFYLIKTFVSIFQKSDISTGLYIAIGGGVIFLLGLLLSICRVWLLTIPGKIKNREGVFKILTWM